MTKQQFNEQHNGQKFIALIDTNIKYTFQLGGGIRSNARTVKAGDVVTVCGFSWDIDTVSIGTFETLNRIGKNYFDKTFHPITMPVVYDFTLIADKSKNKISIVKGRIISYNPQAEGKDFNNNGTWGKIINEGEEVFSIKFNPNIVAPNHGESDYQTKLREAKSKLEEMQKSN